MKHTLFLSLLVVMTIAKCADGPTTRDHIVVMTRNVYVGADVDRVINAPTPEDIPKLALIAYQEVLAHDFAMRADALAAEIQANDPHLIGLQEITTIRLQTPGDLVIGGTTLATEVVFDYLAILRAKLAARGLDYRVVGSIENADAEVPMVVSTDPLAFSDVRMTDYDVVLARKDVTIQSVVETRFASALDVPTLGLNIPRGCLIVHAEIDSQLVRFASTHLEPATDETTRAIQQNQAAELIASLDTTVPTVVVGDLNSGPENSTDAYAMLIDGGFQDAWITTHPGSTAGFTCCFAATLRPGDRIPDLRYDHVLVRGADAKSATLVGARDDEVAEDGLFPSDHAGMVATLQIR